MQVQVQGEEEGVCATQGQGQGGVRVHLMLPRLQEGVLMHLQCCSPLFLFFDRSSRAGERMACACAGVDHS